MIEFQEIKSGVGALIVAPRAPELGFVTIQELATKRSTNKLAGMITFPMETIEAGESHQDAMVRLYQEELRLTPAVARDDLTKILLSRIELTPGAVCYVYLHEVEPGVLLGVGGSTDQEVSPPKWTPFRDILNTKGGAYSVRGGVRESVLDFIDRRNNPNIYQLKLHRYFELFHHVPAYVFDLIERGVSEEGFVSLGISS